MSKMINDPLDRKNVNEWMGNETPWLDQYKPCLYDIIRERYGHKKPTRNNDIPEDKLEEFYDRNRWMEELVAPMVDTVYPITIEDKYHQAKRGFETLNADKVRFLMETYTYHWEQRVYEDLLKLKDLFLDYP